MITTEEYLKSIGLNMDTAMQGWVEREFEWECPGCHRVNLHEHHYCECGNYRYSEKLNMVGFLNHDAGSSGYLDPLAQMEKEFGERNRRGR